LMLVVIHPSILLVLGCPRKYINKYTSVELHASLVSR
jgi:hypothetical protein